MTYNVDNPANLAVHLANFNRHSQPFQFFMDR